MNDHARDEHGYTYSLEEFESAKIHDPLGNAAEVQLVREGRIHNYLRMLWGKKLLEWSRSPRDAVAIMIQLNNKFGLDGRDPNSYSGIFWVLGCYDHPGGPERPVFGLIRYRSSEKHCAQIHGKKPSPQICGGRANRLGFLSFPIEKFSGTFFAARGLKPFPQKSRRI